MSSGVAMHWIRLGIAVALVATLGYGGLILAVGMYVIVAKLEAR